ncbi:MAG: trypsin-like peptidase domain-containing protein [Trueperella sp.]|nr:trypsin-like peptidase domain-containing protein [Trueperella sp.]
MSDSEEELSPEARSAREARSFSEATNETGAPTRGADVGQIRDVSGWANSPLQGDENESWREIADRSRQAALAAQASLYGDAPAAPTVPTVPNASGASAAPTAQNFASIAPDAQPAMPQPPAETASNGNLPPYLPPQPGISAGESPAKPPRRGPSWPAAILLTLLAALVGLGGSILYQEYTARNVRPAEVTVGTEGGDTEIVELNGAAPNWEAVAKSVSPAVVAIDATSGNGASAGSGVIIDAAGHVLTNEHVIAQAKEVYVTLTDGRIFRADVVGADIATDLAVLSLRKAPDNLTVAQLGDSSKLVVGQPVTAIGNPLGLSSTMTTGIISALDRPVQTIRESTPFEEGARVVTNAIQVDAAINPGNSGGPVFDANGRVIGIASSIAAVGNSGQAGSIGLGFAIPINLAKNVASQLIASGVAEHAYLGVSIVDGVASYAGQNRVGAEVKAVQPGTPAARAGVQVGDTIVAIEDRPVSSATSLTGYVRQFASGEVVKLTLARSGKLLDLDVTLATRQD